MNASRGRSVMSEDTMRRLLAAIRSHSGLSCAEIVEAGQHGADAGWAGFTYTTDGAEFYRANDGLVDELLSETADDLGYANVAELVATFERADMTNTRDGRDCLMAWFALEMVGQWLADNPEECESEDEN